MGSIATRRTIPPISPRHFFTLRLSPRWIGQWVFERSRICSYCPTRSCRWAASQPDEPSRLFHHGIFSSFASALDGLVSGYLNDPEFVRIVQQDLVDGQHRNPTNHPAYFTTAFFHHPDELAAEVAEAGFTLEALLAVEGP